MHGEGTSGVNIPRRTLLIRNFSIPLQPLSISHPRQIGVSSLYGRQRFISCRETSDGGMPQAKVSIHNLSMPLQPVVTLTSPQLGEADQQHNRYLIHSMTNQTTYMCIHNNNEALQTSVVDEPR